MAGEREQLEQALSWYDWLYRAGQAGGNGRDEVLVALARYVLELGQVIRDTARRVGEIEVRV